MKTTIETSGYQIIIDETDGAVNVSAIKDDETVEEFSLEVEGGENIDSEDMEEMEGGEDGIKSFDDFDDEGEEEDFGDEDLGGQDDEVQDEVQEEEEEDEEKTTESLKSFQDFTNSKKR